jgi:hypothetical protein
LHGHTHVAADRPVRPGASPRIFSATAVVDGPAALRLYAVRHGRIWPRPATTTVVSVATLAAGW